MKIHNKYILRTPSYSLTKLEKINLLKDKEVDKYIKDFFNDVKNNFALFIASPDLHHEYEKIKVESNIIESKIRISLLKYIYRMMTRETPFGLFSGVSYGEFNNNSDITIKNHNFDKISIRQDMEIAFHVFKNILLRNDYYEISKFYSNNTFIKLKNKIRYIESTLIGNQYSYRVNEIEKTDIIEEIIEYCQKPRYIKEIIEYIIEKYDDIDKNELEEYIKEVINGNLIVSDLNPSLVGKFYINYLIETLVKRNKELSKELLLFNKEFETFNYKDFENENFINELNKYSFIKNYKNKKYIFQIDLVKKSEVNKLDKAIKNDILKLINIVKKISDKNFDSRQKKFIEEFNERFGSEEIPLLIALDNELGIGYDEINKSNFTIPIINKIQTTGNQENNQNHKWTRVNDYFLSLITNNIKKEEIILHSKEIPDFKNVEDQNNFLSFSMLLNIEKTNEEYTYKLDGISYKTASTLLGRFGPLDENIEKIINEINVYENESIDEEKICIAEIIYTPGSRVSNIIVRKTNSNYEIPILTNSQKEEENKINLNDLYISIINDKIRLRSKKLKKYIIPRLSSAHNVSHSKIPIYNFLADLANQDFNPGINFYLGSILSSLKYIPRIRIDNFIISPRKWRFDKNDLKKIQKGGDELKQFIKDNNIPDEFTIDDGDNKMYINTKATHSIEIFLSMIKQRKSLNISEFNSNKKNSIIKDENNEKYYGQFIFNVINDSKNKIQINDKKNVTNVKRKYEIEQEWLYYKIYISKSKSDDFLIKTKTLLDKKQFRDKISYYFFIRYNDSKGPHLRLRLKLKDIKYKNSLISEIGKITKSYIESYEIKDITLNRYEREIERYTSENINTAEELFYLDSKLILNFYEYDSDIKSQKRFFLSFKIIDIILESFNLDIENKLKLISNLSEGFYKEFNGDKNTNLSLSKQYRIVDKEIEKYIDLKIEKELIDIITKHENEYKYTVRNKIRNKVSEYFISSLIHMSINRLFVESQRKHELVIYDFIKRYYKSKIAKIKYEVYK